jgi:hypothetical protein
MTAFAATALYAIAQALQSRRFLIAGLANLCDLDHCCRELAGIECSFIPSGGG